MKIYQIHENILIISCFDDSSRFSISIQNSTRFFDLDSRFQSSRIESSIRLDAINLIVYNDVVVSLTIERNTLKHVIKKEKLFANKNEISFAKSCKSQNKFRKYYSKSRNEREIQ